MRGYDAGVQFRPSFLSGVIPALRAFASGERGIRRERRRSGSARDPSLRLKGGFARDDAVEVEESLNQPGAFTSAFSVKA